MADNQNILAMSAEAFIAQKTKGNIKLAKVADGIHRVTMERYDEWGQLRKRYDPMTGEEKPYIEITVKIGDLVEQQAALQAKIDEIQAIIDCLETKTPTK